jgi:outer membrane immunogenic protein
MRSLSLTVSAALLMIAIARPAWAADLPVKSAPAPMPAPPVVSWTGLYVGLHAGWGWSNSKANVSDNLLDFDPVSLDQNGNGVVGGLQVGYNWQAAPNWLIGIEGDFSGTAIRQNAVALVSFGGTPVQIAGINHIAEQDIKWLATLRGRLGYTAGPWLLFVTGGGAWAGIDYTAGPSWTSVYGAAPFSHTSSGWTAGGGFEYAFTNKWIGRLEYLYYDLGAVTFVNPAIILPTSAATTTWDTKINVVRAGVNYKF